MGWLQEASVVVIGGSSGMGLATAMAAAAEGATVTIGGRDPEKLQAAAEEIGPGTRVHAGDVSDEQVVKSLFESLDQVDHVAFFAGEQPRAPVTETELDLFRRAVDSRVWAAVTTCKYAAPRMPDTGSFTFASGISAHRPRPDRSVGATATAALESFSRAMAVELAPRRSNVVCPGAVNTPVLDRFFGERRDDAMEAFAATLPVQRIGRPEDIAAAVLFLMQNSYITGITLRVDGGAFLM